MASTTKKNYLAKEWAAMFGGPVVSQHGAEAVKNYWRLVVLPTLSAARVLYLFNGPERNQTREELADGETVENNWVGLRKRYAHLAGRTDSAAIEEIRQAVHDHASQCLAMAGLWHDACKIALEAGAVKPRAFKQHASRGVERKPAKV